MFSFFVSTAVFLQKPVTRITVFCRKPVFLVFLFDLRRYCAKIIFFKGLAVFEITLQKTASRVTFRKNGSWCSSEEGEMKHAKPFANLLTADNDDLENVLGNHHNDNLSQNLDAGDNIETSDEAVAALNEDEDVLKVFSELKDANEICNEALYLISNVNDIFSIPCISIDIISISVVPRKDITNYKEDKRNAI